MPDIIETAAKPEKKQIIFSGIQPTGVFTLGNWSVPLTVFAVVGVMNASSPIASKSVSVNCRPSAPWCGPSPPP